MNDTIDLHQIQYDFRFSEMSTGQCNICVVKKKNEHIKNILFLKIFHQEIASYNIANKYFLIIYFQQFLCDISKKDVHPTRILRILWIMFCLLLCFLFSMSTILKEFCF